MYSLGLCKSQGLKSDNNKSNLNKSKDIVVKYYLGQSKSLP